MSSKSIPVFFSVNDRYAAPLATAIASLIDHASDENNYDLIVLYQELSQENQDKISSLTTNNVNIRFIALDEKFGNRFDNDQNTLRADYITLTIYYRLFIGDMFPEFDKAIYVDADILIRDDIAKLYDIDLMGSIVGAANDRFIATDPVVAGYANDAVGISNQLYVNSGVLLMNLKKFRDTNFTDKFLELLTTYHFKLIAPDQDYLNAIAKDDIYQLPMEWNLETAVMPEDFKPARLVHYNLFEKPWQYNDVPFADEFWQAAKRTPYYEQLATELASTTDEIRAANDSKAGTIMRLAKDLVKDPITLKSVLGENESK
ncbi:glycosyltransferase family 8 protein [Lentilactobacillus sp. SPB1-3]|uniref:Glycosyltransferase family 8 protein n=1 Tax=Lentilactobacillus terminaliae TaxID=3003483 RepID=A0ACD5DGK5_9LACO|nr:glycosyltransferase family 8 protein [Lentilactobacillus sp. SPB1-3]MCZ0976619.1 glycosyltransferase family 8 protein [Lentilactobacillus sp. SPB1-3]